MKSRPTWLPALQPGSSGGAPSAGLVTAQPGAAPSPEATPDPQAFAAPYASYTLTQGPHGASYGHLAIDLAA